MAVAVMLADDGKRGDGRWKRGAVPDNGQTSDTGWGQSMKRAGHVIDHAPDLGPLVISGAQTLRYG